MNKWEASWCDFWRESQPPHWFLMAIWRAYQRERSKMIPSCNLIIESVSVSRWLLLLMESMSRTYVSLHVLSKQHTKSGREMRGSVYCPRYFTRAMHGSNVSITFHGQVYYLFINQNCIDVVSNYIIVQITKIRVYRQ